MAFPTNPVDGQLYNENGKTWLYVSPPGAWTIAGGTPITVDEADPIFLGSDAAGYSEAPIDGTPYSRQDGGWVAAGGGGATAINDLTDVNTSGVTGGQVLKYNGATWTPADDEDTDALSALTDTTITSPANGEVLTYNGSAWVNAAATGGYTDSDVDAHLNVSGATNGQVLSYTSGDYAWVDAGGGGASGADDDLGWVGPTSLFVPDQDMDTNADGDYTFEIEFYIPANGAYENIFAYGGDGVTAGGQIGEVMCYKTNTNGLTVVRTNDGTSTSGTSMCSIAGTDSRLNLNGWNNVVVQRESGAYRCWVNGSRVYTGTPATYTGTTTNGGLRLFSYCNGTTIGAASLGRVRQYRYTGGSFLYTNASTIESVLQPFIGLKNENAGTEGVTIATGATDSSNYNIAIGVSANPASSAVVIGWDAGNASASNSVHVGYQAGLNTPQAGSVSLGYRANYNAGTGTGATSLGYQSGFGAQAAYNTNVGYQAGYNSNGTYTTAIGYRAGGTLTPIPAGGLIVKSGDENNIAPTAADGMRIFTKKGGIEFETTTGFQLVGDRNGSPDSARIDPVNGVYIFPNLPTADPAVAGQLWNNSGVLTVSAG